MVASIREMQQRQDEVLGEYLDSPEFQDELRKLRSRVRRQKGSARELEKARQQGYKELHDKQVRAIERLLEQRSIKLSPRQRVALSKKSAKQLVTVSAAAVTADSSSEFVRKARLSPRGSVRASSPQEGRGTSRH